MDIEKISNVTRESIEAMEAKCIRLPQVEMPLTHSFATGVYIREIFMPAGTFVIGHEHKTEHFNIVLTGSADVMIDGTVQQIIAPCIFKSGAGVRKLLVIHEDMRWATVHATTVTDINQLEYDLVVKTACHQQLPKEAT